MRRRQSSTACVSQRAGGGGGGGGCAATASASFARRVCGEASVNASATRWSFRASAGGCADARGGVRASGRAIGAALTLMPAAVDHIGGGDGASCADDALALFSRPLARACADMRASNAAPGVPSSHALLPPPVSCARRAVGVKSTTGGCGGTGDAGDTLHQAAAGAGTGTGAVTGAGAGAGAGTAAAVARALCCSASMSNSAMPKGEHGETRLADVKRLVELAAGGEASSVTSKSPPPADAGDAPD